LQIGQKIIIPVKEESSFKTLAVKVEAKNEKSITIENEVTQKTEIVAEEEVIDNRIVESTVTRKVFPKKLNMVPNTVFRLRIRKVNRE
jgi:hypothetical protein